MADIDVQGYLRRLGMDHPGEPSVEGLFALNRAHVEQVAYTSLQIHLGQRTTTDPYESARRVVAGDSGYCYHLNGAFGALLEELGYDVAWHRGRVYSPTNSGKGPIADEPNHLAMSVEAEGILYYVDTGLGDALHEPLLLAPGETVQGPYTFQLSRTTFENGSSGWHLLHDPKAESFTGMVFEERIADLATDFTARHDWMETDESSTFVKKFDVLRRDASGVDQMRGCLLKRKEDRVVSEREITDAEEWFDVLADVFGLRLPGVDEAAQERLWKRVWAKHQEWNATAR